MLREEPGVGAVLAYEQTGGRGRFGRAWHSPSGDSLSTTLILRDYRDHPSPQFLGMAVALAAAMALHCGVAWPNDLMVEGRKLGGVLTEIVDGVPLVGIGANLNADTFPPEIAHRATSLHLAYGGRYDPREVAERIVATLAAIPEPRGFDALLPLWATLDRTLGKRYRLPSGEMAIATGVGEDGRLLCSVEGEAHSVMAADAWFG